MLTPYKVSVKVTELTHLQTRGDHNLNTIKYKMFLAQTVFSIDDSRDAKMLGMLLHTDSRV